jgi:hypothetical protein
MKRLFILLTILILSNFQHHLNAQEYYIKFSENDKDKVNTVVTRTVSIDRIDNGLIYAYANEHELEKIKSLGYFPEMLPHPSSEPKALTMATTVAQMANWDRYPTYEVYRAMMKKFEQDYPSLCKLDSIGTTVQGRKLYVVKISDNVLDEEAEPDFFYTSTMHGDETTGYIFLLRLIDYLLTNNGSDDRITDMVNSMAIYINPNGNPDGTYRSGNHTVSGATRSNANNYDINRNFPDPRVGENPGGTYQPETLAMMAYAGTKNFSLSANFHGGIELANFPWDSWTTSQNAHPDHNWYYTVSRQYADLAQLYGPTGYFDDEDNGVTQGGDWYVITGGRQDYMNYWHHCREITLEVSNTKLLGTEHLQNFWNYNKESLLTYIEWLYTGIQGSVTNQLGDPLHANITVLNHDQYNSHVFTKPNLGNYVRMIEPGTWQVSYSAEGYITQIHTITVPNYTSLIEQNVVLIASEQTTLNGTITDAETELPINGVKVELLGTSVTPVYTNTQGYYSFGSIPENTYQIRASKTDYLSQTVTETLVGDENEVDFILYPSYAESFETVIPQGFTFTGGNWTRDNSTAYDGDYSMKSAAIGNNQQTSMQITLNVSAAGNISFARKVSSESGYDFLKFYIDGVLKGSWSGNQDWAEVDYPVTVGNHTFKWEYSKDGSQVNGSDCAWVDFIIFPQSAQNVTFVVTSSESPVEGASVNFNGQSLITSTSGLAVFNDVSRGNAKSYTIIKDNYFDASGSINVQYVDVNVPVILELLPNYYDVTFSVSDSEGFIEGASVSINGYSIQTNSDGEAFFEDVAEGTYMYTVDAEGYIPQEGELVVNEDKEVPIILELEIEPYTVTFNVSDMDEVPIEGAVVSLNGNSNTTNAQGEVIFLEVNPGVYSYTVDADEFIPQQGTVVVDMDKTINITLEPEGQPFTVTFIIKNNQQVNIEGAVVSLNGDTETTNHNGEAIFYEVQPGIYDYTVEADTYITYEGNIVVDEDKIITINLQPENPLYTVTFYVYNKDEEPVESVTVTFNSEVCVTDEGGKAYFSDIAEGNYSYRIEADGYHQQENDIYIDADELINIYLTLVSSLVVLEELTKVDTWPNPFSQWLNIRINTSFSIDVSIDIYSITGQKVATVLPQTIINNELICRWLGSNEAGNRLPEGLYIVRVMTGNEVISKRVLFMP